MARKHFISVTISALIFMVIGELLSFGLVWLAIYLKHLIGDSSAFIIFFVGVVAIICTPGYFVATVGTALWVWLRRPKDEDIWWSVLPHSLSVR